MQEPASKKRRIADDDFDTFVNNLDVQQQEEILQQALLPDLNELLQIENENSNDSTPQVLNFESTHVRLRVLEHTIIQHTKLIEQLMHEREVAFFNSTTTPTIPESSPKWSHLLRVGSACICIRDRKTMKILAVNDTAIQFVKKHTVNAAEALQNMNNPNFLAETAPASLLFLQSSMVQSNVIKTVSLKVFLPIINVLVQTYLHVEDDFFWIEATEIATAIYDDAFVMDDFSSGATKQIVLPMENKQLAYQVYLQHSKQRDALMMQHFLSKNKVHVEMDQVLKAMSFVK